MKKAHSHALQITRCLCPSLVFSGIPSSQTEELDSPEIFTFSFSWPVVMKWRVEAEVETIKRQSGETDKKTVNSSYNMYVKKHKKWKLIKFSNFKISKNSLGISNNNPGLQKIVHILALAIPNYIVCPMGKFLSIDNLEQIRIGLLKLLDSESCYK